MTSFELRNKLIELFPDYKFSEITNNSDSIFGVKELNHQTFRNEKKNLLKTKNRIIFVSSEMYPNTDENFRYAINYTQSEIRPYRCKNWSGYEYEKIFVSGKTEELLINEIEQLFQ